MTVDSLQKQDEGPGDRLFRKGRSGKPAGRPPGSRNRATVAAEALLEGEAQALTRKAIELALEGDTTALRLCLERIVPQRKSRTVAFDTLASTGSRTWAARSGRSSRQSHAASFASMKGQRWSACWNPSAGPWRRSTWRNDCGRWKRKARAMASEQG